MKSAGMNVYRFKFIEKGNAVEAEMGKYRHIWMSQVYKIKDKEFRYDVYIVETHNAYIILKKDMPAYLDDKFGLSGKSLMMSQDTDPPVSLYLFPTFVENCRERDKPEYKKWVPYKIVLKKHVDPDNPTQGLKARIRDLEGEAQYYNIVAGVLEFVLYVIPFGEATDHLYKGEFKQAAYTTAKDILTFGVGLPGSTFSKPISFLQKSVDLGLSVSEISRGVYGIYEDGLDFTDAAILLLQTPTIIAGGKKVYHYTVGQGRVAPKLKNSAKHIDEELLEVILEMEGSSHKYKHSVKKFKQSFIGAEARLHAQRFLRCWDKVRRLLIDPSTDIVNNPKEFIDRFNAQLKRGTLALQSYSWPGSNIGFVNGDDILIKVSEIKGIVNNIPITKWNKEVYLIFMSRNHDPQMTGVLGDSVYRYVGLGSTSTGQQIHQVRTPGNMKFKADDGNLYTFEQMLGMLSSQEQEVLKKFYHWHAIGLLEETSHAVQHNIGDKITDVASLSPWGEDFYKWFSGVDFLTDKEKEKILENFQEADFMLWLLYNGQHNLVTPEFMTNYPEIRFAAAMFYNTEIAPSHEMPLIQ
jgi:hypothetical protein